LCPLRTATRIPPSELGGSIEAGRNRLPNCILTSAAHAWMLGA